MRAGVSGMSLEEPLTEGIGQASDVAMSTDCTTETDVSLIGKLLSTYVYYCCINNVMYMQSLLLYRAI